MKRILFTLLIALGFAAPQATAQVCTPINCSGSLPAYGGICDTMLATGRVNVFYSDFESFVLTGNCFDAGLISPQNAGTNVRITNVDNFTYSGQSVGLSGASNQASYSPPQGGTLLGCVRFQGTPTQVGVFKNNINFLADVTVCSFPFPVNDNAAGYGLRMTVLPDPAFTLPSTVCINANPLTLTPTGTTGGVFSGPGVTGTTFNPATAGVGTHSIKYKVSKQEGAAIAPATDSLVLTITVQAASFTYYLDTDNDGYGVIGTTVTSCSSTAPTGYAAQSGDCNNNNNLINPGSPEVCDNIDNNCNVQIDEGLTVNVYYLDNDNDGYGNGTIITTSCSGLAPSGYVANDLDCDDANANINPGEVEIPNNQIDENCDGNLGVVDNDSDGFNSGVDCNDNNNTVYPGAPELCDGLDNDCDNAIDEGLTLNTYYLDGDSDGYGSTTSISTCAGNAPTGYVTNNTDCNDANSSIHPGATEVCDGIDNDCAGGIDNGLTIYTYFPDNDNDNYGDSNFPLTTCNNTPPTGYVVQQADCNDANPAINPSVTDIPGNNIDEDCSGADAELDNDGDGTPSNLDCDDNNNTVYPGAPELCDGLDNDCDNSIDEGLTLYTYYRDADLDTYGDAAIDTTTCDNTAPVGYVNNNTDCNDANGVINPGGTEIPNNGIDEDCTGGDLTIGLNSIQAEFGLSIYPNPAQNFVVVNGKITEGLVINIFDLQGKIVQSTALVQGSNYQLDITGLKGGYYMLEVANKNTLQHSFIKLAVIK